jgi:hypothetical protein
MPIRVPSILAAQQRGVEIGRIRMGAKVEFTNSKGERKERPNKLAEFRLTSPSRQAIEAAADKLKGTAQPWKSPSGPQWEVYSSASVLDVIIPPGEPIQQDMELWGKRNPQNKKDPVVCLRRCAGGPDDDGNLPVNRIDNTPCACPVLDIPRMLDEAAAGRACKPTTRLRVALPDLPGIGVWRLESHGFYAAVELAGRHDLLAAAAARGAWIPAQLRLEQRQRGGKSWGVPVLDIGLSMMQIRSGEGVGALPAILAAKAPLELPPAGRPALPPPSQPAEPPAAGGALPAAQQRPAAKDDPPSVRAQKYADLIQQETDVAKVRQVAAWAGKAALMDEFVTVPDSSEMQQLSAVLELRLEELTMEPAR